MGTAAGRELRQNLPSNVPKLKREKLIAITKTTRDLAKKIEDELGIVDPLDRAYREVGESASNLRMKRDKQLRGGVKQAQDRARSTLAEKAKREAGVLRATAKADAIIQDYLSSPAAVPSAARTAITAANEIYPAYSAALRQLDDPVATALADSLDAAPRNLEDLLASDGEMFTYVPDTPANPQKGSYVRTSSVAEPTAGLSRRKRVKEFEVVKDPVELVRKQAIDNYTIKMQRALADEFTEKFTDFPDDILRKRNIEVTEGMTYDSKARELKKLGYVQYNRHDLFRTFKESRTAKPDDLWVKREIADAVEQGQNPQSNLLDAAREIAENYYDPITNTWKASVLAARPLWLVNNYLGNMAMAAFFGHMTPVQYARFMSTAIELQRGLNSGNLGGEMRLLKGNPAATIRTLAGKTKKSDVIRTVDLTPEMVGSMQVATGTSFMDTDIARGSSRSALTPQGGIYDAATQPFRNFTARSYRINSAVDDTNRSMLIVARLFTGPDGKIDFDLDPTQAALDDAVRAVNDTFGSYQNLSGFEQAFLRRVFPFYTWVRHITGALWKQMTNVNEIDRTLMFAHVVKIMGEPNEEESLLPEWAESRVFAGYNEAGIPTFRNFRGGDPFSEGLQPFQSLGSVGDATRFLARSSGPIGQTLYERASGRDALSGTTLSGIGGREGQQVDLPLSATLVESFPQARLLRDAYREQRGETTIRADDDTPLPFEQDPMEGETTMDRFVRYMGGYAATPLNVDAIRENELEDEASIRRQREDAEERRVPGYVERGVTTLRDYVSRSG